MSGLVLLSGSYIAEREWKPLMPKRAGTPVFQSHGTGDALLSYASLAVARTNNIVIASILGALGAAVVCERQGNTPVSPREVEEKISTLERQAAFAH